MHIFSKPFRGLDLFRLLSGIVLAALSVCICAMWFGYRFGIVIACLFLVAGIIKIKRESPFISFFIIASWGVFCVFLSAFAPVWMVFPEEWSTFFLIGKLRILLNLMVTAVVYGLLLILTGKIKPAVIIASTLLIMFASANGFVYQFRLIELKPTDFLSIGTAMNVASQYKFTVNPAMVYCWLLYTLSIFAAVALPKEKPILPTLWYRILAFFCNDNMRCCRMVIDR